MSNDHLLCGADVKRYFIFDVCSVIKIAVLGQSTKELIDEIVQFLIYDSPSFS